MFRRDSEDTRRNAVIGRAVYTEYISEQLLLLVPRMKCSTVQSTLKLWARQILEQDVDLAREAKTCLLGSWDGEALMVKIARGHRPVACLVPGEHI
jgi:hypothetical protein